MNRRSFLAVLASAVFALAAAPGLARADSPYVFAPGGLALGGTDPVAYFTEGRAVSGRAENALMWMGATWLFASAANRATFEADPHRYAPAFGGYCAYSVSRGYTASGDPEAFAIKDGRLYLTHSVQVRGIWSEDTGANIARARKNWPGVLK